MNFDQVRLQLRRWLKGAYQPCLNNQLKKEGLPLGKKEIEMLELIDIKYSVKNEADSAEKQIIKGVNMTIADDSFTVITGPNGSGKSSLAKIIMGIIKPTSGKIVFNGQDITNLSITERAQAGIGFAFQQPVRFKGLYVKDLLRLASGKELSKGEACGFLSEVGLCANDYIDREVNGSLSGGELKRIEIATLIARGVKVSVFDEPEAGIDLWSFNSLIQVFKKIRASHEGSVVIISHQERILDIADKIILLESGKVKAEGGKDDIMPQILKTSLTRVCGKLDD